MGGYVEWFVRCLIEYGVRHKYMCQSGTYIGCPVRRCGAESCGRQGGKTHIRDVGWVHEVQKQQPFAKAWTHPSFKEIWPHS
jgi:hypothetical protein